MNRNAKNSNFDGAWTEAPASNAHVIEYVRDRLREAVEFFLSYERFCLAPFCDGTYYFGDGIEDDLRIFWDEAAAGEMMMEQTLMKPCITWRFASSSKTSKKDPFFDCGSKRLASRSGLLDQLGVPTSAEAFGDRTVGHELPAYARASTTKV